jgi:hypothetical protein
MTINSAPVVLSESLARDGRTIWQARRGSDRGRLEVVAIVPPSSTPTVIAALTEPELRELLESDHSAQAGEWKCTECGTQNDASRRWCVLCSNHNGARA